MEFRDKMKFGITVASLALVTVFLAAEYRRRRLRNQKFSRSSCYMLTQLKPQAGFKRVLADNSYSKFKHLKIDSSSEKHPYEAEITALVENPQLDFDFLDADVALNSSESYVWIETEPQLLELADVLSKEKVFAVDTEQHGMHSFLGFTALIQISTHKENYLVDTMALHDLMGTLCPVFADPSICKVFHGADNDVLWLQRDFHIYVVNMFDTAKACDVLSKPQRSLAYLLESFCGVSTNKLLQREDWSQRPLPEEMLEYARIDSHYLLSIANGLVAELKERTTETSSPDDKYHFLLEASRRSNMICLQLYAKDVEEFPGNAATSSLLLRHSNGYGDDLAVSSDMEFQDIVRRLCAWRDLMARVHDESLRYVLSDQAIVALADQRPATFKEIYWTIAQADSDTVSSTISSLTQSPSIVVSSHIDDVYQMIQDKSIKLEDILPAILKKCLGPKGTCPLSVFNYPLLVNFNLKPGSMLFPKQNGGKNSRRVARKASRDLFVKKFSCKTPVYHNCRIYANDGRLLCYCDRRKLEWYLSRNLAKLVEENPPGIMLLFEPKGRPEDEDNDFYIQSKKNVCVGCGEGNHYLRYRIIPSCYRVHFPEHLKSHRSHDIVLLCVDCHEIAHAAAEKYKRKIAEEFGIPLFVRNIIDIQEAHETSSGISELQGAGEAGVSPLQLRTAAMALLRHGSRMPPSRRDELTQTVMRYYGGREISEEDLEKALLVGMSPHERRKMEKRKGFSLKHSAEAVNEDNLSTSTNQGTSGHHCSSTDANQDNAEINEVRDTENGFTNPDDSCGARAAVNVLNNPRLDVNTLPKHSSKLSFLGHGPHGKQVVDFLLSEYGDDGIQDFCQRWRQVFVDTVQPRHLPGGWTIRHSGKRDFGEFSVYKPTKKPLPSISNKS